MEKHRIYHVSRLYGNKIVLIWKKGLYGKKMVPKKVYGNKFFSLLIKLFGKKNGFIWKKIGAFLEPPLNVTKSV